MASNQNVNKVVYAGTTLIDLTGDDVTAASVLSGKKFHLPSGAAATGTIATKTSSNLTASGATVTVPAGYYASQATKSVATGSATAPSSISGSSATVSTGTNTLTLSKTVSVTPSVSAGYVSSGTAGNSSVSLTASVTTKAAATITPTTSNQTIAAGTYLTGAQTIAGSSNLVAGNIKSGVSIFGVTGSYKGELPATVTSVSRTYTWIQGGISAASGASQDATNRIRCSGYDTFLGNALMVQVPSGYKVGVREYLAADSSYTRLNWLSPQLIIFTLNSGCKYRFIIGKTDDSDITPSAAPALTIKQITWG